MEFKVYRDGAKPGLRKVFVELWSNGEILNRSRMMVWGPFGPILSRLTFAWRLKMRMRSMLATANIMIEKQDEANLGL